LVRARDLRHEPCKVLNTEGCVPYLSQLTGISRNVSADKGAAWIVFASVGKSGSAGAASPLLNPVSACDHILLKCIVVSGQFS
jgi:hypothetical protein